MSDLNSQTSLVSTDSFVIKDSDSPSFKYLTYAGFQAEVLAALLAQSPITYKTAVPVVVAAFSSLESIVFLDYVSAAAVCRIDLPAPEFAGQRVSVSINVLSGTALTSLDIRDYLGVTLFTIASPLMTASFIVDQDMTWKRT